MNKKKYSLTILVITTVCLIIAASLTIYIDPYFHYHTPRKEYNYIIGIQRYQNDGFMRYLDYDALITGTSMTECFKSSEFDKLFNVKSIKVPFSGATYKEINDNIERALSYNPKLKVIIRSIDEDYFFSNKNAMRYDDSYYPKYLTNDVLIDDVKYLFNKSVLIDYIASIFKRTKDLSSFSQINFDKLYNWSSQKKYGKKSVLSLHERTEQILEKQYPTDAEIKEFQENIDTNIVRTIKENPNVDFYYFIPPYSIVWWDCTIRKNSLNKQLLGYKMIIESLLEYDNAHLFSFSNDFDIISNLNNYKDPIHYSGDVNSYMLEKMSRDENRLTKENYKDFLKEIYDYYSTYDYDSIYN